MITLRKVSIIPVCVLALLTGFSSQAQTTQKKDKTIVGVVGFTSSDPEDKSRAKELQEVITEAFGGNPEVRLLDRSKVLLVEKELSKQKNANYLKGKTVAQNKALGAELLVVGTLTNVMVEEQKIGGASGVSTTKGLLSFALEAIDVATGETRSTKTFDLQGMDAGNMNFGGAYGTSSDVEAGVIRKNKEDIKMKVRGWVNELFPPKLKILSVDKSDKKGLPDEVTIVGGKEAKLEANMLIEINENESIEYDGKVLNRAKPIGMLKVLDIQDDIVVCKVLEGKEIIEKSMTAENIQLKINYDRKAKPAPPNPFNRKK
jgi:hypothetical protein